MTARLTMAELAVVGYRLKVSGDGPKNTIRS